MAGKDSARIPEEGGAQIGLSSCQCKAQFLGELCALLADEGAGSRRPPSSHNLLVATRGVSSTVRLETVSVPWISWETSKP